MQNEVKYIVKMWGFFNKRISILLVLRGIFFAAVDQTFSTFVNLASHVRVLPIKRLRESNKDPNERVGNMEISDFFF